MPTKPASTKPANRKQTGLRDEKGRFVAGASGNRSGRPKQDQDTKDAMSLIRSFAPKAVGIAIRLLESPATPPQVQVKLIEIILDRTYGKAQQSVEVIQSKSEVAEHIRHILQERAKG